MQNYKSREKIGEGTFGTVFKVVDENNKVFAVKKVDITIHQSEQFEIDKLQSLASDHIVELKSVTTNKDQECIQIAMEYCSMNLRKLMTKTNRFTFDQIMSFLTQVTTAFLHIDQKNIIHLDLKPENILVQDQNHFKVCDFGCSLIAPKSQISRNSLNKMGVFGTPQYLAPQMFSTSHCKIYKSGFDVWSLGCILYEMLYGYIPFHKEIKQPNMRSQIMQKYLNYDIYLQFPSDQKQREAFLPLVKLMLHSKNSERPTFHEIKRFLIDQMNVSQASFYNTKSLFKQYFQSVTFLVYLIDQIQENSTTKHISFWEQGKQHLLKLRSELVLYLKQTTQSLLCVFDYKINKYLDRKVIEKLNILLTTTKLKADQYFGYQAKFSKKKVVEQCKKLLNLISPSNKKWDSVNLMATFLQECIEVDWNSKKPILFAVQSFKGTVSLIENKAGIKIKGQF